MFHRIAARPTKTFLLLGPRGTGKSTWLKTLSFDLSIDLLKTKDCLEYLRDPGLLAPRTAHLPSGSWVLIDEVQKVPELLDEVHRLYEERRLHFALSSSSARKLKRSGVNLLAGRAINRRMFPLTFPEYASGGFSSDDLTEWGTLPLVLDQFEHRAETLSSYVDNYLRQELLEEGIVRNIEPFVRFLAVAGHMNGQTLNVENVARESKVGRTTVDKYFAVLVDTLIGFRLAAYQPNIRVNEVAHPKFYFFDAGVARAAAGLAFDSLDRYYKGFLFETYLLNEVRAYNEYSGRHRDIFYYALRSGGEIDLVIQLKKKTKHAPDEIIACEFKLGSTWRSEWAKPFAILMGGESPAQVKRAIVVYTGQDREVRGSIELLPVAEFLRELFAGTLF
ncbi:MAG: AAA family ATPase [Proteobacteria bacterium]|nr:AAA family ATPase [Pseudomonadota bacterium]